MCKGLSLITTLLSKWVTDSTVTRPYPVWRKKKNTLKNVINIWIFVINVWICNYFKPAYSLWKQLETKKQLQNPDFLCLVIPVWCFSIGSSAFVYLFNCVGRNIKVLHKYTVYKNESWLTWGKRQWPKCNKKNRHNIDHNETTSIPLCADRMQHEL